MLTSVACSCMRNGRTISVPIVKLSLFSSLKNTPRSLNLTGVNGLSEHRASRLLASKSKSLSPVTNGGADPLSSSDPPDQGGFGSLSMDISSRRSFRKSSPYTQNLRYSDDQDDEEEEPAKPRWRPGRRRRNTTYWYFLQCKKLIGENKVGSSSYVTFLAYIHTPVCVCVCIYMCVCVLICPFTAAGGIGHVQYRHAAGGEAAAGGVQLFRPDRRLRTSWATQEGLQTLQRCGYRMRFL